MAARVQEDDRSRGGARTPRGPEPRARGPRRRLPGDGSTARTSPARRLIDRAGRGVVTIGGFAVIASVLGIMVFVLKEAAPLFGGATVVPGAARAWAVPDGAAVLSDEYRQSVAALAPDGRLWRAPLARDGAARPVADSLAAATGLARVALAPGSRTFVGATPDGRVLVARVGWTTHEGGGARELDPAFEDQALFELDPAHRRLGATAGTFDGASAVAVAQLEDGSMALARRAVEENALSGEKTEALERRTFAAPRPLTALVLDGAARNLWGGTAAGEIVHWPLDDGTPGAPTVTPAAARDAAPSAITALSLLNGHRALVAGQQDGTLSIWFLVRGAEGAPVPARVRDFPRLPAAIRAIAPSPRDKGFLAADAGGHAGLYYSTSHRTLWTGVLPAQGALFYTPKADGAVVAGAGRVAEVAIRNPHPEISLEALFGKVWYEGYQKPEFVWQSSSGSDDFEPKLGLTPLLLGTLKGTFYSLILAIPLGVLGAMYTSQFMHPSLKRTIKPVVEIMAALPSVVLGFLAGLWLAPRLDTAFPALFLACVVLPAMALLSGALFRGLPARVRSRVPMGGEALLTIGFLAAGVGLCLLLNDPVQRVLFGGRFQGWLLGTTGLGYDQRNAIVVGIAMGFAVIPIIFSVSEEAFSNVPKGLVAGSLALGASRWQTVTQVVLPSASPGIFSAIMIGFGRAIGETMIVLMATGNTPILSWNPFNGFRTLSANIAVEIPEAPYAGTLYRTLFLAGLLLFVLTFAVNTVADIVRQNLRRRFANL